KSMKGVVKSISITGKKKVKAGKSLNLKAKVKYTKGANKKLLWTSSNKKWATVSGSGKVKTTKAGKGKTVKITAAATDGSGKKKTIKIKIK
ncbi:MAG: Ig-like domain-containing protein, partial [Eubacterium sp.]|nr:Ig-like domain-containing protein [Eubacterium sp.]